MDDKIKKNLLDLNYQKYLQYENSVIIISFTFIIGIGVAFLTGAINYTESNKVSLVVLLSIAVFTILALMVKRFKTHQENIKKEIKKLNLRFFCKPIYYS